MRAFLADTENQVTVLTRLSAYGFFIAAARYGKQTAGARRQLYWGAGLVTRE